MFVDVKWLVTPHHTCLITERGTKWCTFKYVTHPSIERKC